MNQSGVGSSWGVGWDIHTKVKYWKSGVLFVLEISQDFLLWGKMYLWHKTILSIKTSKLQWVHFGFESVVWAASALGEFSFLPSVFGISGFKYRYLQGHLTQGVLLWGTPRNCWIYSFVLLQELLFCVVCFVYLHVVSNPSLVLNCSLQLQVGLLSVRSPWKERKWPLFAMLFALSILHVLEENDWDAGSSVFSMPPSY